MAAAWTYSDWITLASGSSARLTQLRLHIREVSDRLAGLQAYTQPTGESVEKPVVALEKYLAGLKADERREAETVAATAGSTSGGRISQSRGVMPCD